jgi:2-aminobenzoate-CoA ligase
MTTVTPNAPTGKSAHVDTFCRDNLPPADLWPRMNFGSLPELDYPSQLNCATELLDRTVEAGNGDKTAFLFPGGRWTYRDVLEMSNRIAHVLVDDLGVVPGNRVLLRGPNSPMMVACWFGIVKAGAVVVCTMPLLRVRELAYIADKAEIALALCDTRFAPECETAMKQTGSGAPRPNGRTVHFATNDPGSLEVMMVGKPATFANCDTAADDTVLIAFTSGTTGNAKGTMHFHRDVMAICDCFPRSVAKLSPDDICCGSPPFAFTFGLGGLVLFPMRVGAASLLLEQAAPPHLIKGIHDHRPTVCWTSPTAYRAMLGMLGQYDVSSLRKCVSAGEHLPRATFEAWERATGIRIIDGIGATEMLHIFISASGDDIRPGSTGRAVPGYDARCVDANGAPVPRGEIGRLAVRGPTGCRYLADIDRQRAYVEDGWNITGDSFREDEDGYFWYVARTDDMIITGGHNVSGAEVENVLLEHRAVQECGVVAAPDEERGHVVKAFIVLRSGFTASPDLARELQDFVKAEIAPYKYPRRVEFVDRLPRTDTGKLQRFRLREAGLDQPDAGAAVPDARFPVPAGWPRGSGYSHAVSAEGRTLVVAGQIGWDAVKQALVPGGLVAQVRQALANIVAIVEAGGARPEHLVRLTWFITDRTAYLRERTAIGAAYRDIIGRHYPAMSVIVVAGLLEPGAVVEIEATAVVPSEP